ncbi:serine hydrolase domain-containing protein [Variovorax sp. UC122_21]|uniref:serine hydrolase domain-containing protein n=1 Tax=Variovorax sp. UC122_21 TaxID=3374554 RepID=UPI003756BD2F
MTSDRTQKLEAILSALHRNDSPGLVASVQHHGKPLLRRGYGMASLDSGVINTPSTKMRIGSTSKHFASALALLLRDEGLLSIDEPVSRWLPELPATQGIRTLRQFMNHTGGTRDYLDLSLLSNGMTVVPSEGAFDYQCRQQEENFKPGEQLMYNNGGYRMLSKVLERVLGVPLAQGLRERLFEPLSMNDTFLWCTDLDPLLGSATSHIAKPDGGFSKGIFPSVILAEGGIASTLDDMQRWLGHLITPKIWPQRLSNELMSPTELSNGYLHPYGFGLIRETWRGVQILHHAGGVVGGTCQMLAAPDHGVQIVVMSNRSDITAVEIAQQLLVVMLEDELEPAEIPASADFADALCGDYHCALNGRHFAIAKHGDNLVLRSFGLPLPLTQSTSEVLRVNLLSVIALTVELVRNDADRVVAIDVIEQGRRYRCDRLESAGTDQKVVERFAGKWHSSEIGGDVVIGEGRPESMRVAGLYGRSTYKLEPLLEDTCLMTSDDPALPLHGTIRLVTGKDGQRELLLDTARTRHLRFTRDRAHG